MRQKLHYLFILSAIFFLSGCIDQVTLDKDKIHGMASTLMKIDGGVVFISDEGSTYIPATPISVPDSLISKRFFIEFQVKEHFYSQYTISLLKWQRMRIEPIERTDKNGLNQKANDNLNPTMVWCSGKYMNMLLDAAGSQETTHHFYMLQDTTAFGSLDTVTLYLRHDSHKDNGTNRFRNAVSFDLSNSFPNTKDTINFKIKYTNYSEKEIPITYIKPKK